MKKLFAIVAVLGLLGTTQVAAQTEEANNVPQTEVTDSAALANDSIAPVAADSAAVEAPAADEAQTVKAEVVEEGGIAGVHKMLKVKFIEGDASFMSLVAIAMVIGLAFCVERIIYLSMAQVNTEKLMARIADALSKNDVEGAKEVCRNTAGPVAAICYQGLLRIDEGLETVERSVVSYGSLQSSMLEKNCSWITLFIAMAPSLGFLGTVIGMVMSFDEIQQKGDISPTIVAGGMKVALITTIYGILVALILQVFYNFILTKIESLVADMEDCSITLLDLLTKFNLKK
ncbi:MAG: MotA/TolQ/ExbB proton channel family protein [Bacteroidaceae bacterium]|nr:MotA/TolQ/ExbB proton channel family protein [Bacteroidaceae bacterium]